MFERELTDGLFVQRWSIVRTLMPQSIAEHTYLVCHYANDIACYLGLPAEVHLALLQYGLWHDSKDEIFTGDLPGPNKRGLLDAIGPDAKAKWDAKLDEWAYRTFKHLAKRSGGFDKQHPDAVRIVKHVLKIADWLEAAVRMATEYQMGNGCAKRHIDPNANGAREELKRFLEFYFSTKIDTETVPLEKSAADTAWWELNAAIDQCVGAAACGQSSGPWITREDERRTYHDPCVDSVEGPKA